MEWFDCAAFWSQVDVREQWLCWEWRGRKSESGYGLIWGNEKAHRVAYTLAKGFIPDGAFILHSCDNRPCCNPYHLRPGTAKDNSADMMARGRFAPRCGEANGNSKLSDAQVKEILTSREKGKVLASRFGVAPSTISAVRSRQRRMF